MSSFYIFLLSILTHSIKSTSPSLTAATCEWVGSKSGQTAACLPNWYINGVCQSKSVASCKESTFSTGKFIHMIQCCQMKYNSDPNHNCTQTANHEGKASQEYCPDNDSSSMQGMYGVCSSGQNRSCQDSNGELHYNAITCCQTNNMTFNKAGCGWKYGAFGDQIVCPSGYAAAGACGGSANGLCDTSDAGVY